MTPAIFAITLACQTACSDAGKLYTDHRVEYETETACYCMELGDDPGADHRIYTWEVVSHE